MTWQNELEVETAGHRDIKDITDEVQNLVDASGVVTGTAHLFVVGSTVALGAMEMEPGLARDLPELLDRLMPPSRAYGHEQAWHDGNGHSHLQATWLGPSLTVPVTKGRLVLGTWQQIFILECDVRPRRRNVVITVSGE
jgi:secondary thiamine-phosphate synthase enzyme